MKTRLVGDIHGNFKKYKHLLERATASIQVGDFGIGFSHYYWHERVNRFHHNSQHRFIRGNHDNPAKCREMCGWIYDGTVEGHTMYIGGAWSIDHQLRTEGVDWWSEEELSIAELDQLVDAYTYTKPRVMITHDAPEEVTFNMFISKGLGLGNRQIKTRTGQALQTMFETHRPEFWFFGHWHHTKQSDIKGTHFHCLGELDFVDFDLERCAY